MVGDAKRMATEVLPVTTERLTEQGRAPETGAVASNKVVRALTGLEGQSGRSLERTSRP
jgi:hypothetical protein